jgi:hypothetical protein
MLFDKGFEIFSDLLFLLLLRRNDDEYVLASGTTNLCPFGWDFGFVQIKLGKTGGTGNDHRHTSKMVF